MSDTVYPCRMPHAVYGDRAAKAGIGAGIKDKPAGKGVQGAVLCASQLQGYPAGMAFCRADETLFARIPYLDRPSPGVEGRKAKVPLHRDAVLAAKRTAEIRGDYADLFGWNTESRGNLPGIPERALGRYDHLEHPVPVNLCHAGLGLKIRMLLPREGEDTLPDSCTFGKCKIRISLCDHAGEEQISFLTVFMQDGGSLCESRVRVEYCREGFIRHLDRSHCLPEELSVLSNDQHHRIPGKPDLCIGKDGLVHLRKAGPVRPPDIPACQDSDDTGAGKRPCRIDSEDSGMRVRRPDNPGIHQPGRVFIRCITLPAGHLSISIGPKEI
ncbi:MAG: hypothetical protein BWX50_00319 [Euryarchaeota archaeon ADurb.Bin009]|nr:MAG: hypothetical protein BWX50_00319 [Euryarchaeota archaeon ADurb.Bin009]